jgi:hypothetical protein
MKRHSLGKKKRIILFSSIFFCLLLYPIGYIFYNEFTDDYYIENTCLEIKSDPAVLDVEYHSDTNLVYITHFIKITYNNGGKIYISNYNSRGKKIKRKPMYIHTVNNYYPRLYSKDKKDITISNNLAIWSAIIGVQLETIVDVAKNYHVISGHMERWTDLSDHKQAKESFAERMERVVENNLYSDTVTIDGKEYVLLKSP